MDSDQPQHSVEEPAAATRSPAGRADEGFVRSSLACVECGYDIRGLAVAGNCPECGRAVADSLRGDELRHSSKEYLRTVRSGLSLVLNAILFTIILAVTGSLLPIVIGALAWNVGDLSALVYFAAFGVSVMSLVGYWKYTAPDPSKALSEDPAAARRVIRVTVAVLAVTSAGMIVLKSIAPTQLPMLSLPQGTVGSVGGGAASGATVVWLSVVIVGWAAWAVQFVSVMRYTRWMASRVPDRWAERRAKRYAWLLPVIAIAGAPVFFLGPLVVLVMYWNLLDRMRKHVRSILATGRPAALKRMSGVLE